MKWQLVGALLIPTLAFAGPPNAGPPQDPQGKDDSGWHGHHDKSPQEMQQMWDKMIKMGRVARVLGLTEKLDLDSATALKMDEQIKKFDDQRVPLRKQLMESGAQIARAAHGDAAAQKDLDNSIKRALDARDRLANLDRDLYNQLSKGLPPQKKAQMALFLARFEMKHRTRWMHHMMGGHGEHDRQHAALDQNGQDDQRGGQLSLADEDGWDNEDAAD
jgi:hypothetical protein